MRIHLPTTSLLVLLIAIGWAAPAQPAAYVASTPATFSQRLLALAQERTVFTITFIIPLDADGYTWRVDGAMVALDAVGEDSVCFRAPVDDVFAVRCTPLSNVLTVEVASGAPSTRWPDDVSQATVTAHLTRFANFTDVLQFADDDPTNRNGLIQLRLSPNGPGQGIRTHYGPLGGQMEPPETTQFMPLRLEDARLCFDKVQQNQRLPLCVTPNDIIEWRWWPLDGPLADGVRPTPTL